MRFCFIFFLILTACKEKPKNPDTSPHNQNKFNPNSGTGVFKIQEESFYFDSDVWKVDFHFDSIIFNKIPAYTTITASMFYLNKEKEIQFYNSEEFSCGVGLPFVDSSSWKQNGDSVFLHFTYYTIGYSDHPTTYDNLYKKQIIDSNQYKLIPIRK